MGESVYTIRIGPRRCRPGLHVTGTRQRKNRSGRRLSLHHDISTITGEEVVLFTLAESPDFREAKRK